jgi:tetratricopeptide (TPR) repeat protein
MKMPAAFSQLALLCAAAWLLAGCLPSAQNRADEEKEPHFLAGKSRVSTLDFKGAIESFEKALEINPRSAAAHFELACLSDQKEADPAAAIYHYQTFLKLRPEAGNADVVKQRIQTCKQELALNVSLGPLTERQQRELEQLTEEKKKLTEQVKKANEDLEKWRAYAARLQTATNAAGPPPTSSRPSLVLERNGSTTGPTTGARSNTAPAVSSGRTHTIKAGDTATLIARKYGIKVSALLAANPGVDERRLQVGRTLSIPTP